MFAVAWQGQVSDKLLPARGLKGETPQRKRSRISHLNKLNERTSAGKFAVKLEKATSWGARQLLAGGRRRLCATAMQPPAGGPAAT